jgi:hypothetical protein
MPLACNSKGSIYRGPKDEEQSKNWIWGQNDVAEIFKVGILNTHEPKYVNALAQMRCLVFPKDLLD